METEEELRIRMELLDAVSSGEIAPEGQEWNTEQLQQDFDVVGFAAPYVIVIRKSDGKRGSLMFRHSPRVYFGFEEA